MTKNMLMKIPSLVGHYGFWNQKNTWFQKKLVKAKFPFFQTFRNAVLIGIGIIFVGVKGGCFQWKKYDNLLNENAPTGESRHFRAESFYKNVVIPIVAFSAIYFNVFARCYV